MILVSGSKSATRWYVPTISGIESSELGSYMCIVSDAISIISVLVIISILDAGAGSSYMSEYMTLKVAMEQNITVESWSWAGYCSVWYGRFMSALLYPRNIEAN